MKHVKILDATWFLPPVHVGRNAEAEFIERRLPNAIRFDLDEFSDPNEKELPHMLPPLNWFGEKMDKLGISPNDTIVVYDALGQFSAPRGFWNLWVLGAKDPKVLDGGLPKWIEDGRPLENGQPTVVIEPNPPGTWISLATPRFDDIVHLENVEEFVQHVLDGIGNKNLQLLDSRPKNRFLGIDPEPRPNLKSGKIPGSLNVPFNSVLNADGTFKDKDSLKKLLEDAGVDLSGKSKVMTTCGSGTSAAILSFVLSNIFGVKAPIYDGAFAQWGKDNSSRPVV